MSEAQVQALLPTLGNDLTGHLMEKKRALSRPRAEADAKMDTEDFNHAADGLGLKPYDPKTDRAALGELKYRVENLIYRAQEAKKEALTRAEKQELMRIEMARTVTVKPGFYSDPVAKPVIALSVEDIKRVIVPAADRAQIVEALKARNVPPTDDNVRSLYLRGKSRAGGLVTDGGQATEAGGPSAFDEALRLAGNAGGALQASLYQANAGIYGVARAGAELAGQAVGVDPSGNPVAGVLKREARVQSDKADAARPRGEGIVESGVYAGIESIGSSLMTLPLALLPGGQGAALAAMAAPVGGSAYNEARDGKLKPEAERLKEQLRALGMPHDEEAVQRAYRAALETASRGSTTQPGPALSAVIRAELKRAGRPSTDEAVQAAYSELRAAQKQAAK